jgi:hypothetical protein
MIKKILTIALVLGFEYTQAQISFGVKGGLNMSNCLFPNAPQKIVAYTPNNDRIKIESPNNLNTLYYDYKTEFLKMFDLGFNSGIFVRIPLKKRFDFIQIELNIEQKGFQLNSQIPKPINNPNYQGQTEDIVKRNVNNSYLVVPVSIGKYFGKNKRFYYEFGVFGAYLMASKFKAYTARSIEYTDIQSGDNYSDLSYIEINSNGEKLAQMHNRIDAGVLGGLGYTFNIDNKTQIIANFRTNVSVLKLGKFNNEFETYPFPTNTGFGYLVSNRNYMYGMNSQARNINFSLSFGIVRSL